MHRTLFSFVVALVLSAALAACNSSSTPPIFLPPQQLFVSRTGNSFLAGYMLPVNSAPTPTVLMTSAANTGTTIELNIAFDTSGDLFIMAGTAQPVVSKLAAGFTSSSTPAGILKPPNAHAYTAIAVDHFGNIWIGDQTSKLVFSFAGNFTGNVTPAPLNTLSLAKSPTSLVFDAAGDLFVGEFGAIERFNASAGVISNGESATATLAPQLGSSITGMALDAAGNLYYGDNSLLTIGRYNAATLSAAGFGNGKAADIVDGGASIGPATQLAFDRAGNLYAGECFSGGPYNLMELPLATQPFSTSLAATTITIGGDNTQCLNGVAVF
jgi:hypothetical protein